jgi:MoaA/NifB/PqqE/SkfB family radical SAM enzyme
MYMSDKMKEIGLKKAYEFTEKNPEENLPKLLDFVDAVSGDKVYKKQRDMIKKCISDPENNWTKLIYSFYNEIDAGVRRAIFENFFLNSVIEGRPRQKKIAEENGCSVPWTLLIDPTSACNLHCTGCWAAEYGNKLNLSLEQLDNIIKDANSLGIYMFLFSGGEPLVRKNDIITLCERHPDCYFASFTNGTLIDEDFAKEMLRVKNFMPAISVEGFEKDTDFRRGEGTFAKIDRAMNILKENHLPFGVSCCYTSKNVDMIGSEEYFDWMVNKGAKFCWFFTYMPVGNAAVPELMATAKQREYMYDQIRKFRKTKPLFTIDFWNDGDYVHGCIAGGRNYLHINANGDYEPCAFIHYSDSNVKDKTLLEALKSPLFMAYHNNQPFNENPYRPCPLLDNPGALSNVVHTSGAKSTDLQSPEDVDKLSGKCRDAAVAWAPAADRLWVKAPTNPANKK